MSRNPFYMKYPYRHKLSILAANKRGAVDLPARIFFNRVPKSANTTVTFATAKICGKNMDESRDVKSAFMRPSEIDVQQMTEFDDCFKFTFVRNPYARVLSAYLDKVASGDKSYLIRDPTIDEGRFSFSDFCNYLVSGGLYANAHWAPQTSLMLLPIDEFDFIGKVESLEHDLNLVVDRAAPERC